MGKIRRYNDKRPRHKALLPREHYVKKNGSWKPKMAFENEASAHNWIESHSWFDNNGYVAYECSQCHQWHIGFINHQNNSKV